MEIPFPSPLFSKAYVRQRQQQRQHWESRRQATFRLGESIPKKYPSPEGAFHDRLDRPHLSQLRCETRQQPVAPINEVGLVTPKEIDESPVGKDVESPSWQTKRTGDGRQTQGWKPGS